MAFSPSAIEKLGTTLAGPPANSTVSENHKLAIEDLRTKMGDPGSTSIITRLAGKLGVPTWQSYTPTVSGISLGTGGLVTGEHITFGTVVTFFRAQVNFGPGASFTAVPARVGLPTDATGVFTGPAMYLTQGNPGFRSGVWSTWADGQYDSAQITLDGVPDISNQLGEDYPESPSAGAAFLFLQGFYRPE